MRYITKSEAQTQALGKELLKKYKKNRVFLLMGDLGGGKTQFVKGSAQALGYKGEVTSPTFNYLNVYDGDTRIYHYDLYREDVLDEDIEMMLRDSIDDQNSYVFVEWAERAKKIWPKDALILEFTLLKESDREILVLRPEELSER